MALRERRGASNRRPSGPENRPRLRLKRKAAMTGYVDGAWWPRDDDLTTELPDLLAVLSVRLGAVARVTYNLAEWAEAPRKVPIGGRIIRLVAVDTACVALFGRRSHHHHVAVVAECDRPAELIAGVGVGGFDIRLLRPSRAHAREHVDRA